MWKVLKKLACANALYSKEESGLISGSLVANNLPLFLQLAGLALCAESIWVTADPYKVYPILGVSGKDDVYAGAWISIFTGFCFFCVCVFGIISLVKNNRLMVLLYLVLILVVYLFECASCISSYTHRDYVVSNSKLVTKQMLGFYTSDTPQGRELTRMWDRFMMEVHIIVQPVRTPLPCVLHPDIAPECIHVGTVNAMQLFCQAESKC
uniref:Uroplakin 1A n=1 Tax=Pseudonaja textilis TaxID=8673 RepID=A0A670YV36_PSETE